MIDKITLTTLLYAIDRLDWRTVRACFADEIYLDYTDLFGGEPGSVGADELVGQWRAVLPGFDATQHLHGPILLTEAGETGVRADAHVRGYHRLGEQVWAVHGHYVAWLRDAKIISLQLQVFYQEGDTGLAALATERALTCPREARS